MDLTRAGIGMLINQPGDLTSELMLDIFFSVGQRGDIIILKNDGIRESKKFSVIITSGKEAFESIRKDGDDLSEILKEVLTKYSEMSQSSGT